MGCENMSSSEPYISVKDIHKSFAQTEVLKGISFDIAKGEAVCIIGPSGSGKSTLLRCLNGLATIDRGTVRVGTHDVHAIKTDAEKIALRKDVSMVFQQFNLFPHKTALENIMMAPIHVLKQDKAEVEERARALLAKVRLAGRENHYPGELSGGQQQRVAIARSLAMRPSVMLFDEVTSALDPETVKEVLLTIRELVNDGLVGAQIAVAVRPEKLKISETEPGAGIRVRGKVSALAYYGDTSHVVIETADGLNLSVNVQNDRRSGAGAMERGQSVWAHWAPEDSIVLTE